MKNKTLMFVVMIPFILLCLLIVRAEHHLNTGTEWDIELTGYDPRDLLRGHYLRLRLDYDWDEEKTDYCSGTSCCLCLIPSDKQAPKVHKEYCGTAKSQCDAYIRPEFETSLDRYYVPETEALRAEGILQQARQENNAYIRLSINTRGEPRILDLLIDGKSLNTLLAEEE